MYLSTILSREAQNLLATRDVVKSKKWRTESKRMVTLKVVQSLCNNFSNEIYVK